MLSVEDTYSFEGDPTLAKRFERAFPNCAKNQEDLLETSPEVSCELRAELLKEVRKASFLDSKNPMLLDYISCVYKKPGFDKNATYFASLKDRAKMTDGEFIKREMKSGDDKNGFLFLWEVKK